MRSAYLFTIFGGLKLKLLESPDVTSNPALLKNVATRLLKALCINVIGEEKSSVKDMVLDALASKREVHHRSVPGPMSQWHAFNRIIQAEGASRMPHSQLAPERHLVAMCREQVADATRHACAHHYFLVATVLLAKPFPVQLARFSYLATLHKI